MQWKYKRAYFGVASVVVLGLMTLMASVDAQAQARIVFESFRDENWEIYVMDADGRNPQRLTDNPASDTSPSWSPNGERIAFVSYRDGNAEIYVMDANGENLTNLTKHPAPDTAPEWFDPAFAVSPASKQIMMWGWLKQVVRQVVR